MPDVMM